MFTLPHMEQCCCFKNLRTGSFASAIYTLVFYTAFFVGGATHIKTARHDQVYIVFTVTMVVLCGFLVLTSILLLIALKAGNDRLMVPWLVSITAFTIVDSIFVVWLLVEMVNNNLIRKKIYTYRTTTTFRCIHCVCMCESHLLCPNFLHQFSFVQIIPRTTGDSKEPVDVFAVSLIGIDIIMIGLNIYCFLCVINQYKEFRMDCSQSRRSNSMLDQPSAEMVRLDRVPSVKISSVIINQESASCEPHIEETSKSSKSSESTEAT
ncbi:uncharacterized protein LOC141849543 isoform X1 [Brevipalpus obovatus]|uniref:uncharacterized protein LOC141849543 isoform X1 n=1 Tax=Brevipalpus obovatus TaxID=246614 RepID=UPI003D9DD476